MTQKKAKKVLKLSEEQFRRAIEDAPIPTIMHAEDGQVLQVSRTWTELTGFAINEIPSFDTWLTKAAYGEGANAVRDHMHELSKGHKKSINVEFPVQALDGTIKCWSFSASSPGTLNDGRRFIVGMAVDITERKKIEKALELRTTQLEETQFKLEQKAGEVEEYANQMEQLAQERLGKLKDAERLAAIGTTAGMVGHDIRNPLQVITSDAYLAKIEIEALPDSEQRKMALESIEEITRNTEYINKIVQDLQDFARPLNPIIEENDLKQIIDSFIGKNGLPKNIKLQVKIDENAREIKADSYYLSRILSNLVSNSVQAMPRGGELTIEARKEAEDTVLRVQDTGIGIPKDIRDKMFTLMFTTKAKGQGFGLPVVKRMTESLGGTVSFQSEEGKGTTFTVRLPPQELNGKLVYK